MKNILISLVVISSILTACNSYSQWERISNGMTGGMIEAFEYDGTNIFAGSWYDGVYISTNFGTSWTQVNNGLTGLDITSLKKFNGTLYAGAPYDGMFVSTNNGLNWSYSAFFYQGISSIIVNDSSVLCGTYGLGVQKTTNNGQTWFSLNSGLTNLDVNSLSVYGSNLYAATDNGVFFSSNNGLNWINRSSGLPSQYIEIVVADSPKVFAGLYGLYLTTNNGLNWNSTSFNSGWVKCIMINDNDVYLSYNDSLFLSTDYGVNWISIINDIGNSNVFGLHLVNSNVFAGTYGGGIFVTTNNGTNWTSANNGISNFLTTSIASNGSDFYASSAFDKGGVFYSSNSGLNWIQSNNG